MPVTGLNFSPTPPRSRGSCRYVLNPAIEAVLTIVPQAALLRLVELGPVAVFDPNRPAAGRVTELGASAPDCARPVANTELVAVGLASADVLSAQRSAPTDAP